MNPPPLIQAIIPQPYIANGKDAQGIDRRLVACTDRNSKIAEQYRTLQTYLYALKGEKDIRSIAVTSARKDEGKTVTCCNLAITLAGDIGKRIVLVDWDLRKPDVHAMLNIARAPGVADILSGNFSETGLVVSAAIPNLFILPAGTESPNAPELLRRPEAKELLDALKSSFDYIIIDTPPVLSVSDSRILGVLCDAVFVVVRSEKTSQGDVAETLRLLRNAHIVPTGCILTDHQPPFYERERNDPY